jgi:beta-glucosidase
MIHHVLLAHGLGIQAIRAHAPKAQAGIVLSPAAVWPNSKDPKDLAASELNWEDQNDWWVLPMLKGHYPEAALKRHKDSLPEIQPGDLAQIQQKLDFLGLNYYSPWRTVHSDEAPGYKSVPHPPDAILSDMLGWEDFPPGLENLLLQFSLRYPKIPLYVTENGLSVSSDKVDADGKVHDPRRLAFLEGHLMHCRRAIDQGVDLRGYFCWSLMDNFEWGLGYTQRFGLTHVDYQTFKRTIKDSGHWYAQVALKNSFEAKDRPLIPSAFVK